MNHKRPGPTTEITDASGQHRLMMRYVPAGKGYNFDALIWRAQESGVWKQRVIITQGDFESGSNRHRWVSEIHSFDPTTGTVILKVAEGDAPKSASNINYIYSWREWSVLTNSEIRLIRICSDPFEKYS